MAITSDKLLNRPSELHRRYAGRLAMKEDLQKRMVQGGSTNIVLTKKSIKSIDIIKDRVIEIDSLLKGTLAIEKKKLDTQRRQESGKRREKEEEKLETKPQAEKKPIKVPSLPRMGFFAWVKNFIGNIILGYFAVRLVKYLPLAVPIVKFIGKATDFVIDIGGKLLDGLATFIDWGYKAYDATRGFMKNLFGEKQAKEFDKLSGLLNKFLNLALIVGMAAAGSGGLGGRGGGAASAAGRPRPGTGGRPKVTTSGGGGAGRPDIRNPLRQRPTVTTGGKPQFRLPGTGPKITGSGAKGILSSVRPFLKRIPLPVVGALIDFGLSVALGESPGRAAFRAIGAGLLGAVGAAAGSVVPVAGNFIGGLLGGMAGDAVGGALYDAFFGNKKPQQKSKGIKAAGGGITRGRKSVGTPVTRTIKKQKTKRTLKVQPTEINPGKSVGGEDKIKKIFPEVETKDKGKNVNPLGYMKSSYNKFSGIPGFGGLASLFMKAQLGERPSDIDYQNAAAGIEGWMQRTFSDEVLRTGGAFAEGGQVDAGMFGSDGDMKNMIAKSIQDSVAPKIDDIINDLMKQLGLKGIKEYSEKDKTVTPGSDPSLDVGPGGTVTGGNADFWSLVAIASLESGTAQGRADVAQSIYNRVASGIYGGKTIKELIVSGNGRQYQPVGRAVNEFKAISDKESAINAVMVANKLNRQQAEKFINDTASSIQNTALQKSAAEFVGGRTDFWAEGLTPPADGVGYVVRNGHRFGWFVGPAAIAYGKKNPGAAKAPALGDITVMGGGPGGSEPYDLGKGYGSKGSKIAGDLGRYIYKALKTPQQFQAVTEHPDFGGISGKHAGAGYKGYHKYGRAVDIGAYAHEQGPILKAVADFNKMKGVKPVQLYDAKHDPTGEHGNHVHVAYSRGGRISKPTRALIGEKGPEFVFDADTTRELTSLAPGLLEKLNFATNKSQIASILQSYTSYEQPYGEPQVVEVPVPMPMPMNVGGGDESSGGFMPMGGGEESSSFDALYIGG